MRNIVYILSISMILSTLFSCTSSKKYLSKGQYGMAVNRSVKKLQRKKTNEKEIAVLKKAYPLAVKQDEDRIKFLNREGEPDRWDEIFKIYLRMKNRQEYVRTVLPLQLNGKKVDFPYVNYDDKIVQAKRKAAEFYYVNAKNLMRTGVKADYREAVYNFRKAEEYTAAYTDIPKLIDECYAKGSIYALIKAKNNTRLRVPDDFLKNLITLETDGLNSEWVQYDYLYKRGKKYDYDVVVNLKIIDVTPNSVSENRRKEKAKVRDGWEYVLDENGNVAKDSLGNDIKQPKYETIYCEVIETVQHKSAHIEGSIDYINRRTKQIIRTQHIAADNVFEHVYAIANGDLRALSKDTRRLLDIKPVAYPNEWDMIYAAGDVLKGVIANVMYDNRRILLR